MGSSLDTHISLRQHLNKFFLEWYKILITVWMQKTKIHFMSDTMFRGNLTKNTAQPNKPQMIQSPPLLALQPPLWLYFTALQRALASSLTRFLDHTQRRATVGRTPLNEWSVRRRDLSLTTHNTHNRQKSMPRVGFESTISAGERQKTYVLDRAATGTGFVLSLKNWNIFALYLCLCVVFIIGIFALKPVKLIILTGRSWI